MDSRRVTIAFIRESFSAPKAMVTESTAGMATGMEATVRIKANCNKDRKDCPRNSSTVISTATNPKAI